MKILFVIYQLDFADHIALSYLSAIAKSLGHMTFFCSIDTMSLQKQLDEIKPEVVAYSANIVGAAELIKQNKVLQNKYKYVSIMGGPFPTYYPETFVDSGMDVYCIGEGEYPFRDFLLCLEKNESFDNIENLITAKQKNPVRPLIKDLDELPLPDRDLVLSNSYLKNTPKKTFYATRGCPYKCSYCSNDYYQEMYRGKGKIVRRFSVDRIIEEIKDVKSKYRMDFIKFGDDLFAPKVDNWLEEFAEKYSKEIGIPFNCYLRIDLITEDLLKTLKKAGCFSIHLSIDSLSKNVREKVLNRKMKDVNLKEILKMAHSFHINTWVNFMLAAPLSSLKEDLDTMIFSKKAKITYTNYSTTVPMKGTALYNFCLENNLISENDFISDMNGCMEPSKLKCFSKKEKNIRYNIYLLGTLISKLFFPLNYFAIFLIKIIPPLEIFKKINRFIFKFYINKKIFLLPSD